MAQAESREAGVGTPQRTLYIGLGGTGKDILLRVRRWMYEKWRVTELPFARFLWMDTDTQGTAPTDIQDPITSRVAFEANEKVPLGMTAQEIATYFSAGRLDSHHSDAVRPDVWLDPSLQSYVQALQHGAGQIRCFGRLAFWHHAAALEKRVIDVLDEFSAFDALERQVRAQGFEGLSQGDVKVVIVAGIAGGTGSGTFIDVAAFVRQLLKERGFRSQLSAVLVLPTVFIDLKLGPSADPDVLAANGYAALMELEHLLLPRGEAGAVVERYAFPHVNRLVEVVAPLYDIVFLVDSRLSSGDKFEKPGEAFRVAADVLTMELDKTAFAQQMRTEFSNMVAAITEPLDVTIKDKAGQPLYAIPVHKRYAALGQAQVVLDRDRLRNAAAYRLGEMLVGFMRRKKADAKRLEPMVEGALDNAGEIGLTLDLLGDRLLRDAEDKAILKTWEDRIAERAAEPERDLRLAMEQFGGSDPLKTIEKLETLLSRAHEAYGKIDRELRDEIGELLYSKGMERDRGAHYRAIQEGIPRALQGLQDAIERSLVDTLADPVERGIPAAQMLIEVAGRRAAKLLAEPVPTRETTPPDKPLAQGGDNVARAQARLDEARSIPGLFFPFRQIAEGIAKDELLAAVKLDMEALKKAIEAYMDGWRRAILEGTKALYDAHVQPGIREVLGKLDQWLGEERTVTNEAGEPVVQRSGMRRRLEIYDARLGELEGEQRTMADAFREANRGVRNVFVDLDLSETELLYDRCLLDAPSKDAEARQKGLVEAMRDFFADAELISDKTKAALAQSSDAVQLDAIREGMRVLIARAEKADEDPLPWRQIRSALEGYAFEKTEPLVDLQDLDAVRMLERREEGQRHRDLKRVVANSRPLLKMDGRWPGVNARHRTLIGTSTREADAVKKWLGDAGLDASAKSVTNDRGSVVVYQDFFAAPVVLLNVLDTLKNHYDRELAKQATRALLRHSDRRWRRYADIVFQPDLEYWLQSADRLSLLLPALLLGVVGWNAQDEQLTVRLWVGAMAQERQLGCTIQRAVEELQQPAHAEVVDKLRGMVQEAADKLAAKGPQGGIVAYGAACRHLLTDVFPPEGKSLKTTLSPVQQAASTLYQRVVCEQVAEVLGLGKVPLNAPPPAALTEALDQAAGGLVELSYQDPWTRGAIRVLDRSKLGG